MGPSEVQPARSHEGGKGDCCSKNEGSKQKGVARQLRASWQEQACIREQAADCLLDGKQVPKLKKTYS